MTLTCYKTLSILTWFLISISISKQFIAYHQVVLHHGYIKIFSFATRLS